MLLSLLTQDLYTKLYGDIVEFRTVFDLPINTPDLFGDESCKLHSSLAIEELTELAQADSKIEQADAAADLLYVLFGRAVELGADKVGDCPEICYMADLILNMCRNLDIPTVECWDEVHASNLSKTCRNQEEVNKTTEYYKALGVKVSVNLNSGFFVVKCAEDVELDLKLVRAGKVLKSFFYRPANLEFVMSE
jgi:hypothetical protein